MEQVHGHDELNENMEIRTSYVEGSKPVSLEARRIRLARLANFQDVMINLAHDSVDEDLAFRYFKDRLSEASSKDRSAAPYSITTQIGDCADGDIELLRARPALYFAPFFVDEKDSAEITRPRFEKAKPFWQRILVGESEELVQKSWQETIDPVTLPRSFRTLLSFVDQVISLKTALPPHSLEAFQTKVTEGISALRADINGIQPNKKPEELGARLETFVAQLTEHGQHFQQGLEIMNKAKEYTDFLSKLTAKLTLVKERALETISEYRTIAQDLLTIDPSKLNGAINSFIETNLDNKDDVRSLLDLAAPEAD